MALPKGMSESSFDAAIAQFKKALGEDNVMIKDELVRPYTKVMMAVPTEEHTPSAVVTATTVEQVQEVVKICNAHKVPVWTISTGRNFGYGSAAPGQRGQVVLDLRKMNKIIHVDPELCTALVEPGVTYQMLYDYLEENKIPLMLSFSAPSAIAGPLGNTMDRGVGYTPMANTS
jgi:4-cresol dehydrogenase (hydroxylating)